MTPEELFEKQRGRLGAYRSLLDATAALLLQHDPITHDEDLKEDEYVIEAQEILNGLRRCTSQSDLTRLVHEVFVSWHETKAGPIERYEQIGRELWKLWGQHAT